MGSDSDKLHDRIRETITNLRDEDLLHVVQSTSGEYTRFARDVAHEEIKRRGGEAALRKRLIDEPASKAAERAESLRASRLKPLSALISTECYIEVWQEKNFEGEALIIEGPGEIPNLCANHLTWCSRISSLRVGPRAFVLAYGGRNFKGDVIRLGPGEEVSDLSNVKFDHEIDSIRINDTRACKCRTRNDLQNCVSIKNALLLPGLLDGVASLRHRPDRLG